MDMIEAARRSTGIAARSRRAFHPCFAGDYADVVSATVVAALDEGLVYDGTDAAFARLVELSQQAWGQHWRARTSLHDGRKRAVIYSTDWLVELGLDPAADFGEGVGGGTDVETIVDNLLAGLAVSVPSRQRAALVEIARRSGTIAEVADRAGVGHATVERALAAVRSAVR